jgi:hypothetical protein
MEKKNTKAKKEEEEEYLYKTLKLYLEVLTLKSMRKPREKLKANVLSLTRKLAKLRKSTCTIEMMAKRRRMKIRKLDYQAP